MGVDVTVNVEFERNGVSQVPSEEQTRIDVWSISSRAKSLARRADIGT